MANLMSDGRFKHQHFWQRDDFQTAVLMNPYILQVLAKVLQQCYKIGTTGRSCLFFDRARKAEWKQKGVLISYQLSNTWSTIHCHGPGSLLGHFQLLCREGGIKPPITLPGRADTGASCMPRRGSSYVTSSPPQVRMLRLLPGADRSSHRRTRP